MTHFDTKLTRLIEQTPKEMSPEHDLWNGIEKQLDKAEFHKTKHWRTTAAASLVLLVGVLVMNIWQPPQQVHNENNAVLITLAEIKQQHERLISQMQSDVHQVNWQASELSLPVEKGIEQLRKAAEQIYLALQKTPNDKELWQLWLWTQQREIELLQQGQQLPATTPSQGEII